MFSHKIVLLIVVVNNHRETGVAEVCFIAVTDADAKLGDRLSQRCGAISINVDRRGNDDLMSID